MTTTLFQIVNIGLAIFYMALIVKMGLHAKFEFKVSLAALALYCGMLLLKRYGFVAPEDFNDLFVLFPLLLVTQFGFRLEAMLDDQARRRTGVRMS